MDSTARLDGIVQAHTSIGLSVERFEALLSARELVVEELDDLRLHDLYLALACVEGDEAALTEFTQTFSEVIHRIARQAVGDAAADDVVQRLLTHLLVPQGDRPPRLASYQGSGSLRGFVRMTASRLAIDTLRADRARRPPVEPSPGTEAGAFEALALEQVKDRMGVVLEAALRSLKPQERRVLRMRFVLGFSVKRTAQALGVHENSVPRLVARARQRLLEHVQQDPDLPSHPSGLVAAAEILDVSVSRYLESHPELGAASDA